MEEATGEPYRAAIDAARRAVSRAGANMTPQQRVSLGRAIELNLINRKEYPVELLCYTHQLPIGKKQFYKARRLFCQTLLEELHLMADGAGESHRAF